MGIIIRHHLLRQKINNHIITVDNVIINVILVKKIMNVYNVNLAQQDQKLQYVDVTQNIMMIQKILIVKAVEKIFISIAETVKKQIHKVLFAQNVKDVTFLNYFNCGWDFSASSEYPVYFIQKATLNF